VSVTPTLAASAACFRDGKVLIAKRIRPPLWSLPGGRIEPGETPEAAAKRELMEETGVEAEIVALAGEREVILKDEGGGVAARFKIFAYAARWRAGEAKPGPEASEVAWVEPAALSAYKTTDGLLPIVLEAERIVTCAGA
jgi:8-oxo-dGTP pyrophosphatase MutT (NUDIX family)